MHTINTPEKTLPTVKASTAQKELSQHHPQAVSGERQLAMAIDQFRRMDNAAQGKSPIDWQPESMQSARQGAPQLSEEEIKAAKMTLLKNPDIFTQQCRGGFASGGDYFLAEGETSMDTFPFLRPRSVNPEK